MFILHDFQQMFNLKRQYAIDIHGSVSIVIFIVFISLQCCVITDSLKGNILFLFRCVVAG